MQASGTTQSPLDMPDWLREQTRQQQARAPYCGLGFKRGRLEPELHSLILEQLRASAGVFQPEEHVPEIGTTDLSFIPCLYHENHAFNAAVSEALKPAHEEWSGMTLTESACYGFRVYQRGSYLYNHVDRESTHIISSTICVDHRLEEPWPLTIEDIYGETHQLDMEPGEFLFYEGARLIHGRPQPLVGDYYVGMFVHYRPLSQEA